MRCKHSCLNDKAFNTNLLLLFAFSLISFSEISFSKASKGSNIGSKSQVVLLKLNYTSRKETILFCYTCLQKLYYTFRARVSMSMESYTQPHNYIYNCNYVVLYHSVFFIYQDIYTMTTSQRDQRVFYKGSFPAFFTKIPSTFHLI